MTIHYHFKASARGRQQRQALYHRFKLGKQVGCQTDSPVGIVSNLAVFYADFEHGTPHSNVMSIIHQRFVLTDRAMIYATLNLSISATG